MVYHATKQEKPTWRIFLDYANKYFFRIFSYQIITFLIFLPFIVIFGIPFIIIMISNPENWPAIIALVFLFVLVTLFLQTLLFFTMPAIIQKKETRMGSNC